MPGKAVLNAAIKADAAARLVPLRSDLAELTESLTTTAFDRATQLLTPQYEFSQIANQLEVSARLFTRVLDELERLEILLAGGKP